MTSGQTTVEKPSRVKSLFAGQAGERQINGKKIQANKACFEELTIYAFMTSASAQHQIFLLLPNTSPA
jgi:hypothetical protein